MSAPSSPAPPLKPAALQHLRQARHNYQLYQELKAAGTSLDWAVTVLFYTALRLVEAFLAETASSAFDLPTGHEARRAAVRKNLPRIFADYRLLEIRSTWARYHIDKPLPTAALLQQYETQPFARIVAELSRRGISLTP